VRIKTYRGHRVELDSEQTKSGEWVARATIVVFEGKKEKRIPIFGRRRGTFNTQKQADAYALELAKLWVRGRTWGITGTVKKRTFSSRLRAPW
jgi:hypothetical protein